MTAALHLDVARALESALATDGDQLNFAPALDSIRRSMELHSVFLFTCPDATERDRFEIHSISPEKSTPFSNMRLEAEASEFIKSFSDQVVLDWTPLNRFVFRRDPIWELFWQSMVLGPYAGPWEISAVVLILLCHISKIYVDNQRVTQFCLFLKLVISC